MLMNYKIFNKYFFMEIYIKLIILLYALLLIKLMKFLNAYDIWKVLFIQYLIFAIKGNYEQFLMFNNKYIFGIFINYIIIINNYLLN